MAGLSAAAKYGMPTLTGGVTQLPVAPAASNGAITSTAAGVGKMLHPDSPEFWIIGIGAVMLGLIAVSTSVRVGPFKVSGAAGKQ